MNTQVSAFRPRYDALMLTGPGERWRTRAKFAIYDGLKLTFSKCVLLSTPGSIMSLAATASVLLSCHLLYLFSFKMFIAVYCAVNERYYTAGPFDNPLVVR